MGVRRFNQPPIQFFHSTWWVYSSLSFLIQSKNIYFFKPLSYYFSGIKIETSWGKTPAGPPPPPPLHHSDSDYLNFSFTTFHSQMSIIIINTSIPTNFPIISLSMSGNHRPWDKNAPFQYIFRPDRPCVEQGYSKERKS